MLRYQPRLQPKTMSTPMRPANVNISPRSGVGGNPVSPRLRPRESLALKQGYGETRFPHIPTRWQGLGRRSPPKNNLIFIPLVCGASRMDGWCEGQRKPWLWVAVGSVATLFLLAYGRGKQQLRVLLGEAFVGLATSTTAAPPPTVWRRHGGNCAGRILCATCGAVSRRKGRGRKQQRHC